MQSPKYSPLEFYSPSTELAFTETTDLYKNNGIVIYNMIYNYNKINDFLEQKVFIYNIYFSEGSKYQIQHIIFFKGKNNLKFLFYLNLNKVMFLTLTSIN